jgi:endoglucanase
MVVHVEDNGLLKFRAIGGIDPRVLISKPVRIGDNKVPGVIGMKPIHLQDHDEQHRVPTLTQLYIDIGAKNREDALSAVQPGDVAMFATPFETIGVRAMKAKSFDDRIGCAVLVETLKKPRKLPFFAAFTVQEEVGLRGAAAAAYRLAPDIAIALEGTVCADVGGAPGHTEATKLGGGPAFTVQDGHTIADKRFLDFMISVAEKHNIPHQLRRVKGGSNDFGAIHKSREGVIGGGISVPVRYIHAPSQIASIDDYEHTIALVDAILNEIEAGGFTA